MHIRTALPAIAQLLTDARQSVAVAESVTSGQIMASFSRASNTMRFFQGGIVAYNLGQKTRHLDVDPILGEATNSVDPHIADVMAQQVARRFVADWGISITGYAVPVPELGIKQPFAFCSIAFRSQIVVSARFDTKLRGQFRVQSYFTERTMTSFLDQLRSMKGIPILHRA